MKNDRVVSVLFWLLLAVFALGVLNLFLARFHRGDVYPPYSSLRADPLGVKVLYEAVGRLRELRARRNYHPRLPLEGGSGQTWLFAGMTVEKAQSMDTEDLAVMEALARKGNRLVMTFHLAPQEPVPAGPSLLPYDNETLEKLSCDMERRWGFFFALIEGVSEDPLPLPAALQADGASGPPATVSWHGSMGFAPRESAWRTVYAVSGTPVIMERPLGKGTLTLGSDAYWLSNEAMRRERCPGLLAWALGRGKVVVFDETHLGVEEVPGVMGLARRYRLQGFFLGALLAGALLAWKVGAGPLLPVPEETDGKGAARGIDDGGSPPGLTALLRRNIPPADLVRTCLEEWKKTASKDPSVPKDRVNLMEETLERERRAAKKSDPVEIYKILARLNEGSGRFPRSDGKKG